MEMEPSGSKTRDDSILFYSSTSEVLCMRLLGVSSRTSCNMDKSSEDDSSICPSDGARELESSKGKTVIISVSSHSCCVFSVW